jgi:hypothetical protein
MALQDLTPQLRTRLSRVERTVGWFVALATIILIAGLACYIYVTARSRGWFVTKINYATALNDAAGIKPGDPVKLMGFDVGVITQFNLNSPEKKNGITIFFSIKEPFYDYIWYDSRVRVVSDFLGNRYLQVTKGQSGAHSTITNQAGNLLVLNRYLANRSLTNELSKNLANTNLPDDSVLVDATNRVMDMITNHIDDYYTNAFSAKYTKPANLNSPREARNYFFIPAIDEPALGDRLNAVANEVEKALPNLLGLTNQLAEILSNANNAVSRMDSTLAKADPILTNLTVVTGNLRDPNGSLGNWLIPTNLAAQLHETLQTATATLKSAHSTLDDTDTNVTMLALDLDKTLQHLSDLTSNLSWQVQMNTNLISEISTTIVHTDGLIQGLKHHWLLRSAFKTKPVKAPKKANSPDPSPALAPKENN